VSDAFALFPIVPSLQLPCLDLLPFLEQDPFLMLGFTL
jgi:hypothetical protein